jgi:hypothetical protein
MWRWKSKGHSKVWRRPSRSSGTLSLYPLGHHTVCDEHESYFPEDFSHHHRLNQPAPDDALIMRPTTPACFIHKTLKHSNSGQKHSKRGFKPMTWDTISPWCESNNHIRNVGQFLRDHTAPSQKSAIFTVSKCSQMLKCTKIMRVQSCSLAVASHTNTE